MKYIYKITSGVSMMQPYRFLRTVKMLTAASCGLLLACLVVGESARAQESTPSQENSQSEKGPPVQESTRAPLTGQVEFTDESTDALDFTGLWKAHVIEFRRHPKLLISSQVDNHVEGVYSGLLGKFPVSGEIDRRNGDFKLFIDFSKSRLMRHWTSSKSPVAVFNGHFHEGTIAGIANIPEFGERAVHIEAKRSSAQD